MTQAIRFPDIRERLADAQDEGRKVFGERLSRTDADAAGAVQFALIAGVMMQHLVAPERAPSAEMVIRAPIATSLPFGHRLRDAGEELERRLGDIPLAPSRDLVHRQAQRTRTVGTTFSRSPMNHPARNRV